MHFIIVAKKIQNAAGFEVDCVINFAIFPADFTWVNGSTMKLAHLPSLRIENFDLRMFGPLKN